MLLQQLCVSDDMANGRTQVMGYGISKRFQFSVSSFEVGGSFLELIVELANFFLPSLAIAHVIVSFQDRSGVSPLVATQRPSARHDHSGAVGFRLAELAFPAAGAQQLRVNFVN